MVFGLCLGFSGAFLITLVQAPSASCVTSPLWGFSARFLDLSTLATGDQFPVFRHRLPWLSHLSALLPGSGSSPEGSPRLCCSTFTFFGTVSSLRWPWGPECTAESPCYFSIRAPSVSLTRAVVGAALHGLAWPWLRFLPGRPHTLWSTHTAVLPGSRMSWSLPSGRLPFLLSRTRFSFSHMAGLLLIQVQLQGAFTDSPFE